jgi:hypothetical protein
VKGFFHGRIGQTEPLLHEVNAQHGGDGEGRRTGRPRRGVRLDQRNPLCPRQALVHLINELALARSLGHILNSGGSKAYLFHVTTASGSAMIGESYADLS